MVSVNTNKGAITASTYALRSQHERETSLARLSSGLRVNSGSDDAAGLAVSRRMTAQIRSLDMAIDNALNGISLIQTAEQAMTSVNSMLLRMREVSVRMANGIYTDSDKQNAQYELDLLKTEIDRISENIMFNDVHLLDGSYTKTFSVGTSNEEEIELSIISQRADELGKRVVREDEEVDDLSTAERVTSSPTTIRPSHTLKIAEEGDVSVTVADLSTGFQLFASTFQGGQFRLQGDDRHLFAFDGQSGAATATLDFEAGTDTNGDNRYELRLIYEHESGTVEETVTVQLVDIGDSFSYVTDSAGDGDNITPFAAADASSALSPAFRRFVENDGNGGSFSLSGAGVADANLQIDAQTGVISTQTSQITEAGVYKMDVTYTAEDGQRYVEHLTLTTGYTAPVSDTQSVKTGSATLNVTGSTAGYLIEADSLSDRLKAFVALDNNAGTFSLSGADSAYFQISATDGSIDGTQITTTSAANGVKYNVSASTSSSLTLSYVNSAGEQFDETITLNASTGDLPGIQTATRATATALENTATSIHPQSEGAISITSSSYSQKLQAYASVKTTGFSYSLGGADGSAFSINSTTGQLTATLDHSSPADANANNLYEVDVLYSDGSDTFTETVLIYVTGVPDPFQTFMPIGGNTANLPLTSLSTDMLNFDGSNLTEFSLDGTDPDVINAKIQVDSRNGEITNTPGDTTPTGVYHFDLTSKIRYSDEWTSGSNGSIVTTNPKFGSGAFETTQTSGGIEAQDADFAFGGDFTVEFWMRPENLTTDQQILLDFRDAYGDDMPVLSYQAESQRIELFQNDSSSPNRFVLGGTTPVPIIGATPFDISAYSSANYGTDTVRVHITTDVGTIKIRDISDLTSVVTSLQGYGGTTATVNGRQEFTGTNADEIVLEGSRTDIRKVVERLDVSGATGGNITLAHSLGGANRVMYNPTNNHFYREIEGPSAFSYDPNDARMLGTSYSFAGVTSNLATITTQSELDFVTSVRTSGVDHHIDGADDIGEGTWLFTAGSDIPSGSENFFRSGTNTAGYGVYDPTGGNWESSSPNANPTNTDDYLVLNAAGEFDDLDNGHKIQHFMVEFHDTVNNFNSNIETYAASAFPGNHVEKDQWQHVAFVRDSGTFRLFLDGDEIGTSSYGGFDFATPGANALVRFGSNPARSGSGFIGEFDSIHVDNTQALYTGAYIPPSSASLAVSGTAFVANFDGNYKVDENITFTTGFNPTPDMLMTNSATSSLNVDGSVLGYQINANQLSDRLQAYMNLNPSETYTLGGADAGYFAITSDGSVSGTVITTTSAGDGVIFNNGAASTSTFTISNGTFTETVTLNAAVASSPTVTTATQSFADSLETSAVQVVTRAEGQLGWQVTDYSERLQEFAALNTEDFRYSLTGKDAHQLAINAETGQITLNADYENPTDTDENLIYEVEVTYADGVQSFTQSLTLNFTDAQSDNLLAVIAPQTDTFTLSLEDYNVGFIEQAQQAQPDEFRLDGVDAHLFSFDRTTGELHATLPSDSYFDADRNGVYELEISFINELGQEINQLVKIAKTPYQLSNTAFEAETATTVSAIEAKKTQISFDQLSDGLTAFTALRPDGQFALVGDDASLFTLDAERQVITATDLNFEHMRDADKNGLYQFSVIYESGAERYTEHVTLRLGNNEKDDTAELSVAKIDLTKKGGAEEATEVLQRAIEQMSRQQARMGSVQNRLERSISNLTSQSFAGQLSRGRILDADFAVETSRLMKSQLLSQSAQQIISNAQDAKQMLLSLIR